MTGTEPELWTVVTVYTRPNQNNGKMSTIINVFQVADKNEAIRLRRAFLKNFKEQCYPDTHTLDVRPKRAWPRSHGEWPS